ncbi:MAG: SusF/SusE family outer membrane protein [Bacteroidota bacterium]
MKKTRIFGLLAVIVSIAILIVSCTKKEDDVRLDPKLTTTQVLNITSESATIVGFVIAEGDGFTERGVCYNTATAPTVGNNKAIYTTDSIEGATFSVTLTGLDYAVKYYARAYAITENGEIYGEEVSFTTLPIVPELTTVEITDITGNSASTGGTVLNDGRSAITAKGVCYGIAENPTIEGDKTVDGEGAESFVSALAGLKGNTTYYVRAYATNSAGTGYGDELTFTTPVDLPSVTTAQITGVDKTAAVSGGEVTYDGGGTVTARGIVWGETADPTLTDNVITSGNGLGVFVCNLEGLTLSTTYHVRAYATNSAGTAYGDDLSFTTLADITKFWVVGSYNGWDNSDNAEFIISTETSNGLAEGYVSLSGEFKLTTDHSWDDAHTFGDDGSGGLTNPGGNIQVPAAGYYLVKANLSDMSYSLTATTWGVIGSATPGDWSSQTDMDYFATQKIFGLGVHLTANEIKFRGTSDWAVNFGCTAADGKTLDYGGSNIAVAEEDDYALTLDLSHPNAYTYSANRWGLIGSATPGGWGSDQNMSWDAVNKVFTVTVDLIIGEIKYRANDDWGINFGGDLATLTQDGANIAIAEAGNYTITLNPWTKVGTVTKN